MISLNRMREFCEVLTKLYIDGYLNDVKLIKGDSMAISFSEIACADEVFNYIVNGHYGTISIKTHINNRYKAIYVHKIADFKLNRKSLVIYQVPNFDGVKYIQLPDIKIKF